MSRGTSDPTPRLTWFSAVEIADLITVAQLLGLPPTAVATAMRAHPIVAVAGIRRAGISEPVMARRA